MPAGLPLSALLSQLLVAFTVEFDNEFERRMLDAGRPGARLALMLWSNLFRFIPSAGVAMRGLAVQALASPERIKFQLGCVERWGFVSIDPAQGRSEDWGSGRGIRMDSVILPTAAGAIAQSVWPSLFGFIEARWRARFGEDSIAKLRAALAAVADKCELELPHALPEVPAREATESFPARTRPARPAKLPLATLLSQALLAFAIEFDRESRPSLAMCANVIRVLDEKGERVGDLPRLTGASPERAAIGWRLKNSGYVMVERDPAARRGRIVRLTPRGVEVQKSYLRLVNLIEERWQAVGLREALEEISGPGLAEAFVTPPGIEEPGIRHPRWAGWTLVWPPVRECATW